MSASQQKPHGAQFGHKPLVKLWYSPDAACRGMDTDLFYPPRGAAAAQEALDACAVCVVRQACLDAAMGEEGTAGSQRYGVRGGLTPEGRSKLLRKERDANRVRRPRGRPRKTIQADQEEAA